jgi:hypothetical protein
MILVSGRDRPRVGDPGWVKRLRRPPSPRVVVLSLIGIAVLSTALRIALVTRVQAPTVFNDELGYSKLAQSIGENGKLALFDKQGVSYSPLYPLLLAPIYAVGASAPAAYDWIKIVNALLISLSIFPIYKIARFVLYRRASLLVAALSAFAPLMNLSSFTMSENLAYPVCLGAIWMMLVAVSAPGLRNDALLLGSICAATVARLQLIVLIPAALTAALVAGTFERDADESVVRSVERRLRRHALLFGTVAVLFVAAAIGALLGVGIFSVFGRYAEVGRRGFPDPWHFLNLVVRHLAGLDLALGVVPFVGALVAAAAFARSGSRGKHLAFAAVASCVTTWLLLEVAWDAALFDGPHGDAPRIHERFLIYVMPFFLTSLIATVRLASRVSARIYVAAAACAALLPVVIPFDIVINNTISFESIGLEPFARVVHGALVPVAHPTIFAVWIAATFGLLYVVVRERLRSIVILVLIPFLLIGEIAHTRIESAAGFARSKLPAHRDWVDRARPTGGVVLVTGAGSPVSALETAYNNLSIARLYYICRHTVGPDFGDKPVTIDAAGRLRDASGFVSARYAVMPAGFVVRGRIVASNPEGKQVLVAPPKGPLSLPLGSRPLSCTAKQPATRQPAAG